MGTDQPTHMDDSHRCFIGPYYKRKVLTNFRVSIVHVQLDNQPFSSHHLNFVISVLRAITPCVRFSRLWNVHGMINRRVIKAFPKVEAILPSMCRNSYSLLLLREDGKYVFCAIIIVARAQLRVVWIVVIIVMYHEI